MEFDGTTAAGFLWILANAVTRTLAPSADVPACATVKEWWGSPVVARGIATCAEYALYREEAAAFGLLDEWDEGGRLYMIWLFGETASWAALVGQSHALSFIEDSAWAAYHAYVYSSSSSPDRYVLLPVIAYYLAVHLPRVLAEVDLKYSLLREIATGGCAERTSATWVLPGVVTKLVMFLVFVRVREGRPLPRAGRPGDEVEPRDTRSVHEPPVFRAPSERTRGGAGWGAEAPGVGWSEFGRNTSRDLPAVRPPLAPLALAPLGAPVPSSAPARVPPT